MPLPSFFLSLCLALCFGQHGSPEEPASAGVARLSLEKEIRATVDGRLALTRVKGILLASDGRILIGQPNDKVVLVFSPDGELTGRIGREGEGPGEFRWISSLGWFGDSLWVSDIRGRRITVFDPGFSVMRTEPTPMAGVPVPYVPGKLMLLADGSFLHIPAIASHLFSTFGETPPPIPITRHFPDSSIETFAELPIDQVAVRVDLGGARATIGRPFARGSLLAVSPNGHLVGFAETMEGGEHATGVLVRVHDVTSGRFSTLSTEVETIPLTGKIREEAIEKVLDRLGEINDRPSYAHVEAALNLPSNLPAVSKIILSDGGSVFLRLSEVSNSWLILREEGQEVELKLPVGEDLEFVSESALVTVSEDEFGLPSIRQYSWEVEE